MKKKKKRAADCFLDFKAKNLSLLEEADSPAVRALKAYLNSWEPEKAETNPALKEVLSEIDGANFVFYFDGKFLQEDAEVTTAWQSFYSSPEGKAQGICLVTGQNAPLARLHPAIKGVRGAQTSGASLISFNAPAFCSYGKEQGMNAQTGEYAAFAYGIALNHLIADWEHTASFSDTLVLFWASGGESAYQDAFSAFAFGKDSYYSENDLREMLRSLSRGKSVAFNEAQLDPNKDFYILGITPNSARLSVRFFLYNSFGNIVKNAEEHQERLEIVRPNSDNFDSLPFWKLLAGMTNQKTESNNVPPILAGEMLRAILENSRYPAGMINAVTLRIRADREVTRERAAAIKAYYLKNQHIEVPKEVLTVALNPDSTNVPYTLGRLFSVLEMIQSQANPNINSTIRDKYFNSASSTPSVVFPMLINLSQKHLKKLPAAKRIYDEKLLSSLMGLLEEGFPTRLTLPQQGAFQLGYYHQTQERYTKKEN